MPLRGRPESVLFFHVYFPFASMFIEECTMRTQTARTATLILMLSFLVVSSIVIRPAVVYSRAAEPVRRIQTRKPIKRSTATPSRVDYSNFSHRTVQHVQACETCHKFPSGNWKEVRVGDAAFQDITEYPQHTACMSCHKQEFFRGAQPVFCSVCHVSVSPKNSPRFPFPSLGAAFYASSKGREFVSDFNIKFPHDIHIELVSRVIPEIKPDRGVRFVTTFFRQETKPKPDASCAVCHQTYQPQGYAAEEFVTAPPKDLPDGTFWLKKGAFKTVPITHETCFTCHSVDSGLTPAPSDCNACHKLPTAEQLAQLHSDFDPSVAATMGIVDKLTLIKWRKREAGAFRHEWFSHAELSCADCHAVASINTLEEKTKKVPIKSCGGPGEGCHITKTIDDGGILNYVIEQRKTNPAFQCRKCHIIFGKQPVPQSHLDALTAIMKK